MNKSMIFVVICALSIIILLGSSSLSAKVLKETDKGIKLIPGEELNVLLRSNPTTGYGWRLAREVNKSMLIYINNEYKAPNTRLVGAGGHEIWHFKALKPGKTELCFKYIRPWEKKVKPQKTIKFNITIK